MSYDRKIDQVCPHLIVEEPLFIGRDRQIVRPIRPISSASSVRVRLNGELEVPSGGYLLPATATGSRQGPFTVVSGVNDTLLLEINKGSTQVVQLTAGKRISPSDLADDISRQLLGISASVTRKYQIRLSTHAKGRPATLFLKVGSTAASLLGLAENRLWRGVVSAPGWSIIQDPNTFRLAPTRLLVFDEPLKGWQSFVELNYTTVRQECRRCGGLGVENDWVYNREGNVVEARDEALLIQESLKLISTFRGSNQFHRWYGTIIADTVGKKMSANNLLQNFILSDIYEAFRRWQSIKKQQEEVVGQELSDEEYPLRLSALTVDRSQKDPTIVFINVTVQNRSGKQVQIERGIKIPQPEDLLGSTAQQGAFRQSLSNYSIIG